MKKTMIAAVLAAAFALTAAECTIDFSKAKAGDKGIPGFSVNAMGKYENLATVTVEEGSSAGKLAIKMVSNPKRSTSYFQKKSTPAKAGDTLKITAKVKGTGKASFGVYSYAKSGGFVPAATPHKSIAATADGADFSFETEILETTAKDKDGNLKAVGGVRPVITVGANSDLLIEDVKFEIISK